MNSSTFWLRRWRRISSRALPLVIVLAAVAGCSSPPDPPPGPVEGLTVLHYDVDLTVDVAELSVTGRATISFVREPEVERIDIGLNGPRVDSVLIDGRRVAPKPRRAGFSVDVSAAPDSFDKAVYYHGRPREGLYRARHRGRPIVFTDGWPNRNAGWLPGLHHPAHPATLDLTLRTDPELTVAASGAATTAEPGTTRWHLSTPAPTYTFAFAVAPYERFGAESGDVPITHYALREDRAGAASMDRAEEVIAFFDRLLGPYPYETLSTVQVPFDFAGMENASAAFLQAALYGTGSLEEVMVHEIAHQWFGNALTIADWRDLWVSEGVTSYLTTMFYEDADGQDAARAMRAEAAAVRPGSVGFDRPLVPERVDSPYEMLTWLPYHKGAAVMHLLRLRLGDGAFLEALREAYVAGKGGPVSTDEFLLHFSRRANEPLDALIEFWVYGSTLPRLETRWDEDSGMLSWTISGDGATLDGLPIEIELTADGNVWYVDAAVQAVEVVGGPPDSVRPVGVMMIVD